MEPSESTSNADESWANCAISLATWQAWPVCLVGVSFFFPFFAGSVLFSGWVGLSGLFRANQIRCGSCLIEIPYVIGQTRSRQSHWNPTQNRGTHVPRMVSKSSRVLLNDSARGTPGYSKYSYHHRTGTLTLHSTITAER